MKEINNLLKSLNLKPISYSKSNSVYIITTNKNKYVIKKTKMDVYEYLESRSFESIPKILYLKDYIVYEYIDEVITPNEQKILDLIYLVSLLHKKTSYFKNISENEIKTIYEDMVNRINNLRYYYDDLMNVIESREILSPSNYYLARNYTIIIESLGGCERYINKWYSETKNSSSFRVCLNHLNLSTEHIINDKLISFEHAKVDIPVYDLASFYRKVYDITDYYDIYLRYIKEYPLNNSEIYLFLTLILLPSKLNFKLNEYENVLEIQKEINYLIKTKKLVQNITSTKK